MSASPIFVKVCAVRIGLASRDRCGRPWPYGVLLLAGGPDADRGVPGIGGVGFGSLFNGAIEVTSIGGPPASAGGDRLKGEENSPPPRSLLLC